MSSAHGPLQPGRSPRRYPGTMHEATSDGPVSVGVRELKNQLSSYLDRVKAGEEITVTERGRPIARLTSIAVDVDRRAALIEAGIIRPASAGRRRLPSRRVKIAPGESLGELVAEQRR
jgi:prevent-host-death family protein